MMDVVAMPFGSVIFAAAGAKSLISVSILIIKHFAVSLVLSYFVASSTGLAFCTLWGKTHASGKISRRFWLTNGVRCFIRDVSLVTVFYCFIYGSIPRVSAIFFTTSFFLPLFGRIFLKTVIPPLQWLFLILGYSGLLIILTPLLCECSHSHATLDILVLLSAFGLSASNTMLKYLMRGGMTIVDSLLISNVLRFFASLMFMIIFHKDIAANIETFEGRYGMLALIVFLCAAAQNCAQILHTYTFRWGRLPFLGIMDLWRFVFDAAAGYAFFGHTLSINELCGVGIICFAILGIALLNWREARVHNA